MPSIAEDARVDDAPIAAAVGRLAAAGLVAYPTETVWGLAADASNAAAVARLRRWKGSADSQPISVLVSGIDDAEALGFALPPAARLLAEAFWPGPVTLVATGGSLPAIARADGAVGLRCSSHPAAMALGLAARRSGLGPLTATSLNRHAAAPARCRAEAEQIVAAASPEAAPLLDVSLDAFDSAPSTVIDVAVGPPSVLRWGAVTHAVLAAILSKPTLDGINAAWPGREPS